MTRTRRVCFDNSAWSALLNEEKEHDLPSLRAWMRQIETKAFTLIVPAIVITEAYADPRREKAEVFARVLLQPYVEQVSITVEIAIAAGELRRRVSEAGMKLKTPDALIVAAAEYRHCDFLITCDNGIVRMDGCYELSAKIGLPRVGLPEESPPLPLEY